MSHLSSDLAKINLGPLSYLLSVLSLDMQVVSFLSKEVCT